MRTSFPLIEEQSVHDIYRRRYDEECGYPVERIESITTYWLNSTGGVGTFTPAHSIELHLRLRAWLTAKLGEPFGGPTVVVTHHLPSSKSVFDRFIHSPLSACCVSNLDHLFGKMSLWIHGHAHDSFDYAANGTHVVYNPGGYVTSRGAENFDFNPAKVITLRTSS